MALSYSMVAVLAASLLVLIGVPVGLFFVVRHLIRYNARLRQNRTQQQAELEKMKTQDL